MSRFAYITNRVLANRAGQEKGKIRVIVPTGSDTAQVEYICPECGHSARTAQPWQRPFAVKCERCAFLMRVPSMRAEIKRTKK